MNSYQNSHYGYIEKYGDAISEKLGLDHSIKYVLTAHGDKGYSYQRKWEKEGIPFNRGMALYLASYMRPYSNQVRETLTGWVAPDVWVISKYKEVSFIFEEIENEI